MSEYPHAIPVDRINTSLREQTGEWRVARHSSSRVSKAHARMKMPWRNREARCKSSSLGQEHLAKT